MMRKPHFYRSALAAITLVLSGCSGSKLPISVTLSPATAQAIDQGSSATSVTIMAYVTNDTYFQGVTWSLSGSGSLVSQNSSWATYNAPTSPLASGQKVTVTATSVGDPSKTASLTITVNPQPSISGLWGQALASGTVGTSYSETVSVAGGTAPFQWSIDNQAGMASALPDGLTLDASTGTISGTPAAAGTWDFSVNTTDAKGMNALQNFSIAINPQPTAVAGNPVPFLNQSLTPTAVAPGGPQFTLNVSGTGFISSSVIDWNGAPLTTQFVDGQHLTALVPAANIAAAETALVTVVSPAPGGGASNAVNFQVGAPQTMVRFASAVTFTPKTSELFALAVADFNQDGKPDLAIGGNELDVELGNGDGTFKTAPGSPEQMQCPAFDGSCEQGVTSLTVGDFNHSGHLGLAVPIPMSTGIDILLGNGDGTLSPSSAGNAYTQGYSLAAQTADFSADGNLGLAILNGASAGIISFDLGYGDGAFNQAGSITLNNGNFFPDALAVGDFNGDGKLDLALASSGTKTYPYSGVDILLGNGYGGFAPANGAPVSAGQSLSAIVVGDFNGDGKQDLAVADSAGNAVLVLLGNGDGTFQTPITIPVGNQPWALVEGDLNNDGKLDLAVANYGDNTVTLLLGNGDGTFTEAAGSPYPVGMNPSQIVAADFNGDGKLDLAVGNSGDNTVSILLQQ